MDPKSLTVDAEFQRMVPQPTKSELALLERSILDEKGCCEALLVWEHAGKSILLDGHTRRTICLKLGIQVPIRKASARKDKEDAKAFVKKVPAGSPEHATPGRELPAWLPLQRVEAASGWRPEIKRQGDRMKEETAERLAKLYEVMPNHD